MQRTFRGLLKHFTPYCLLLPAFCIIFPILIYPLIRNIYLSFFSYNIIIPDFKFVAFKNYTKILSSQVFLKAVRITLIYTVIAVSVEFVWGMGLALVLNANIRLRRLYRILAILPYLAPPAVIGLIWRLFWDPEFGPINKIIRVFGINGPAWIADKSFALYSVIFTNVWRDMPFVALIFLSGLQSLPRDPYDAAMVDGATRFQIFRLITLPLLKPIISVILLFQTIFTLRTFDIIWILTEGGPGGSTQTISVIIYRTLFRFFDGGRTSAMSVILLSLSGLLSWGYFRVLYKEMET